MQNGLRPKILLLEDDVSLSEIVSEYLEEQGYQVSCAFDANEANDLLYERRFDVLLFDVKVPYQSGFDLLAKIRADGNETPAIFLTSLNSIEDLSHAYEVGCDDYLKKPFELKELLLRLKSIEKRAFYHKADQKLTVGEGVLFDLKSNKLYRDNKEVALPKKEALILRLLLKHRGSIVSAPQIFENAWDYEDEPSELSLRTYIKNLRKLIGRDAIENLKGQGYSLR